MSVEMKLGRWETQAQKVYKVSKHNPGSRFPWLSEEAGICWTNQGKYWSDGKPDILDLVRYLGPLDLSPAPVCADQAGTPVVSTVSTETAGEQLKRMRDRYNAMEREASIYRGLLASLDQAMSDLYEAISRMEKEVEG